MNSVTFTRKTWGLILLGSNSTNLKNLHEFKPCQKQIAQYLQCVKKVHTDSHGQIISKSKMLHVPN